MRISDWSSDVCSSDLEPIELLPAIEHQLQRSDAQREHREAECVEPDAIGILRLTQKQRQPEKGKHAHGQVDVEHPAPREIIGQPAAERGADDRPEDRAHAPDRPRPAVAFGRYGVEQDRLAHWTTTRAENALE